MGNFSGCLTALDGVVGFDVLHMGLLSVAKPPGCRRSPRLTSILLFICLTVKATDTGRHPQSSNWPSLKLKSKTRRSCLWPLSEGIAGGRLSHRVPFSPTVWGSYQLPRDAAPSPRSSHKQRQIARSNPDSNSPHRAAADKQIRTPCMCCGCAPDGAHLCLKTWQQGNQ